ncbi:hypothetical protein [Sphingobium amiense]|uniref:hypothetical protein n=1 Tax=Sphingobium amiense TaxID=135719 RepID=UPI001E490813|nr:hypothetical protein [Sphingobium amiense]
MKRMVLKGAALSVAPCLIVIACLWPLGFFFSYSYAPCEDDGWLQIVSRIVMPLAFAVAAWLMSRAARKNLWRYFFFAAAVASAAFLTTWLAYQYNARSQKICAGRSLSEAVQACQADPKYVGRGTSPYGNPTFSLVSPGITDEARQCLQRWSYHNQSPSLVVDRSAR